MPKRNPKGGAGAVAPTVVSAANYERRDRALNLEILAGRRGRVMTAVDLVSVAVPGFGGRITLAVSLRGRLGLPGGSFFTLFGVNEAGLKLRGVVSRVGLPGRVSAGWPGGGPGRRVVWVEVGGGRSGAGRRSRCAEGTYRLG